MEALSSQSSIASVSDKQPSGDALRFSIIFWITFLVFLLIAPKRIDGPGEPWGTNGAQEPPLGLDPGEPGDPRGL